MSSSENHIQRADVAAGRLAQPPRTSRISWAIQGSSVGDYIALTKPEITFLVVLSSVAGFSLGSPPGIDVWLLLITIVGIGLTSAGAGALNHYLERDYDRSMKRTSTRPIPSGRVPAVRARNFGVALTGAGLAILCPLVNPMTSVLAALTVALYLFVYTPMKRKSSLNTLVGTLPGALPVIGGYAAATNSLASGTAWLLFCVLAFWQMPHFLSLAWMYRKDYSRGGFEMLPVRDVDGTATVRQTVLFTAATIVSSIALAAWAGFGVLYVALAAVGAAIMIRPTISFARSRSNADARRVLKASVVYIPVIVLAILLDRLV
ncbi:MAG: heme o synthase [Rhodothermia bacterium]|nr:heme o synthase [Rhodothermia bacterium]